jgi:hypothetical protein
MIRRTAGNRHGKLHGAVGFGAPEHTWDARASRFSHARNRQESVMELKYEFTRIEKKWQDRWEKEKTYRAEKRRQVNRNNTRSSSSRIPR